MPAAAVHDAAFLESIAWRSAPHTFAERVSDGRWKPYSYQRLIGRKIAEAVARGNGRLIVHLPPRHGKSDLCGWWAPTWYLDNLPQKVVFYLSYGAEQAEIYGRKVRDEFARNPNLLTRLKDDSKSAGRWNTPEGGGMYATGIGGPVLGKGPDLAIIDDPHKTFEEAQNWSHLQNVIDWFGGTFYSRLEPNATIVVVHQALNVGDLGHWLASEHGDQWEVITLPAIAGSADPLGRQLGAALCPQRKDEAALAATKIGMPPHMWEAMFQQNPLAIGGGRLYSSYDPARNDDKTLTLRRDLPLDVSFDFNANPGMHVVIGQTDTAADLFTAVHEIHGPFMRLVIDPRFPGASALEHLGALVNRLGGWQWPALNVFADATGKQKRSEATHTNLQLILEYVKAQKWPLCWKVPESNPPVRSRIDSFNAALCDSSGVVHYRLHPTQCPRLRADLMQMKPDVQGLEDKRDDALSHASSAEGYRVFWMRPMRMHKPSVGKVVFG